MTVETIPGMSGAESRISHRETPWLIPATAGCPSCGTLWIITSPAPLGTCERCGAPNIVLPPYG
jgi:hypothetical protein